MTIAAAAIFVLFIASLCWTIVSDLTRFIIPNAIPVLLTVLFLVHIAVFGWSFDALLPHIGAGTGMLLLCFLFFMRGYLGGGDAKLLAAVSLWAGLDALYPYIFSVAIIGGVFALVMLLFRKFTLPVRLSRIGWVQHLHQERKHIPYGVAIAGGAFATSHRFPEFTMLFAG